MSRSSARGVVLILVSSLIVLMIMTSLFILGVARATTGHSAAVRSVALARLAAASGCDYALARMAQDPLPRFVASQANRCDDWTCRDGPSTPPASGRNPSYARGEPWRDLDADGSCEAGEPTGRDLDGDGACSPWTGRLRGGGGPFAARFSIRIESTGSRIPVNAGFVDTQDRNGNGKEDRKDLAFPFHEGIAHVLNNLGAMALPAGHPRLWEIANSGPDPFHYSLLGYDLVQSRPAGGYRSASDLKRVLLSLGGGLWYPADASGNPSGLAEILPYLDLMPPVVSPQLGLPWGDDTRDFMPIPSIELSTAPETVLQCLWRYLETYFAAGVWEENPRCGPPGGETTYVDTLNILFPDEAERLAKKTVAYRRNAGSAMTWNGYYRWLLAEAESADAVYDPLPGDGKIFRFSADFDPMLYPIEHKQMAQGSADLAFMAIYPKLRQGMYSPPITASGWGIGRLTGDTDLVEAPSFQRVDPTRILHVLLPAPFDPASVYPDPLQPFSVPNEMYGPSVRVPPLTLRPPVRLSVESAGATQGGSVRPSSATLSGVCSLTDCVLFASQEDFENRSGAPELSALGIVPVNDKPWPGYPDDARRRGLGTDALDDADPANDRVYRRTATLPDWDKGSFPTGVAPSPDRYSRYYGSLTLASREAGRRGADLYWPFGETDAGILGSGAPDGDTPQGFPSEPGGFPWKGGNPLRPMNPNWRNSFSPYWVIGQGDTGLRLSPALGQDCPGAASGTTIDAMTIEGWCTDNGMWMDFYSGPANATFGSGPYDHFRFQIVRNMNHLPRTYVHFYGEANWANLNPPQFVGAIADDETTTGVRHFMLAMKRNGGQTAFHFYIDGIDLCTITYNGVLTAGFEKAFFVTGVDDFRIHAAEKTLADETAAWSRDKFVRTGSYRSPLYRVSPGATLRQAQWTGMRPFGMAFDLFTVQVTGYRDMDGTDAAMTVTLPPAAASDPSSAISSLPALGMPPNLRSFRYTVDFDASAWAGPLADSPVFDHIWLTFERSGRSRAWSAWETR